MASLKEQAVVNGGLIVIKCEGVPVGRAQSLNSNRNYGTADVYEIGSIMPQEHVQNRYQGTIQLNRFLIRKNDLAIRKIAALGEDILSIGILDIEILDKSTNKTLRCFHGCTCTQYNETFQTNTISGENATWSYLYCTDGDDNGNFIDYTQYPYTGNVK